MYELVLGLYQALSKKDYSTVLLLLKLDNRILQELFEDKELECIITDKECKHNIKNQYLTTFVEWVQQYPDAINFIRGTELCKLAKIANKIVMQKILESPLLQHALTTKCCLNLRCCEHALMYIAAMCENFNADQNFFITILNSSCLQRENLFDSIFLREAIFAILKHPNVDKQILITIFNLKYLQRKNPINHVILSAIISHPLCRTDFILEILSEKYRHLMSVYKLTIIAKNEYATPKILWKILSPEYKNWLTNSVLVAIASNRNVSPEILWHISSPLYKNLLRANVLAAVSANRNANPLLLKRVLLLREVFYRKDLVAKVAANRNANQEILQHLLTISNDKTIIRTIAAHRNAGLQIHEMILTKVENISMSLDIIVSIVFNPLTQVTILQKILNNINIIHENTKVIAGTTAKLIHKLATSVLEGIAAHKNTNEEMLKQILYKNERYMDRVVISRLAANPNTNLEMLQEILYGKYSNNLNLGIITNVIKNPNSDQKIIKDVLYGKYSKELEQEDLINIASDPNTNDIFLRHIFAEKYIYVRFGKLSLDIVLDRLIKCKASSHVIMSILSDFSSKEVEQHQLFKCLLQYKEIKYMESRLTILKALPNSILNFSKEIHHILNFIDLKDNNRNSLFFGSYDKYFLHKKIHPSGDDFKDSYELQPVSNAFVTVCNRILEYRKAKSYLLT